MAGERRVRRGGKRSGSSKTLAQGVQTRSERRRRHGSLLSRDLPFQRFPSIPAPGLEIVPQGIHGSAKIAQRRAVLTHAPVALRGVLGAGAVTRPLARKSVV